MIVKQEFTGRERTEAVFPQDLLRWLDQEQLAECVSRSISDAGTDRPLPLRDRVAAGLILFCYARGLFASAEVASFIRAQPRLRRILGDRSRDWGWVPGLRRRHSAWLRPALEEVLRAAWRANAGEAGEDLLRTGHDRERPSSLKAIDGPDFVREAQRRLEQAAFLDSIALDE